MAKKSAVLKLNVFLNNKQVGVIERKRNGAIEFIYAEQWLLYSKALPISLSLPLTSEKYVGDQIYVILDNLLPDNQNIRRQIAIKVGAKSDEVIDLLAVIGRDCVGALRFILDNENINYNNEIKGKPLCETEIAEKIKNLKYDHLGISTDSEFRISLAGAQEKTSLLYFNNQWMEPIGSTPTTHILKPQIGKLIKVDLSQSVENEHFCLEFIRNLGLPCAKSWIEDFENVRTLIIERFDRAWTNNGHLIRIPQEDCCQIFGISSSRKYEKDDGIGISKILNLLRSSDEPSEDRYTFYKAQIIYWLLAATDAHAKNYSIALFPGGRFKLTPLYDVITVQPYFDNGQIRQKDMKLAMAVEGKSKRHYKIDEIIPRHFIETGKLNGFSTDIIEKMFDELIKNVPIALENTYKKLEKFIPDEMANSIINGINQRLKLLKNYGD